MHAPKRDQRSPHLVRLRRANQFLALYIIALRLYILSLIIIDRPRFVFCHSIISSDVDVDCQKWEVDEAYSLKDFVTYDLHAVLMDSFLFFFVGRLYKRPGMDRLLPNIVPVLAGCILTSFTGTISWMQHSVSIFDIMCGWPWQLFVYVLVLTCGIVALAIHNVRALRRQGTTCTALISSVSSRLVEIVLLLSIFLGPYLFNPNFHFHHWYASWLFGMCLTNTNNSSALESTSESSRESSTSHTRNTKSTSSNTIRITHVCQMYLWGCYVNGIAVYGRDPLLSCNHAFFTCTSLECDFMSCYAAATAGDDDAAPSTEYEAFVPPNWHNCSGQYT
jgi:hypothetical protein